MHETLLLVITYIKQSFSKDIHIQYICIFMKKEIGLYITSDDYVTILQRRVSVD